MGVWESKRDMNLKIIQHTDMVETLLYGEEQKAICPEETNWFVGEMFIFLY